MMLVRTVMQVKFGHMDAVLGLMKEYEGRLGDSDTVRRVLTDASGQMFTLVVESEAESIDSYMSAMWDSFKDPEMQSYMGQVMQHIESGRREFYNIEMQR